MIVMGIVFVVCIYISAFIGKLFKLSGQTVVNLSMWVFLVAICSIFYALSLAPVETFH